MKAVEAGQWRKPTIGVWAVLGPHPKRKGFWLIVRSNFPYRAGYVGRRELEALPIVSPDYFGRGKEHPGVAYQRLGRCLSGG